MALVILPYQKHPRQQHGHKHGHIFNNQATATATLRCISAPNAYTADLIASSRLHPSNHLSSTFRFTATIRYHLIAADTAEERIRELHGEKRALAEDVLDGTGAAPLTPEELMGLFR